MQPEAIMTRIITISTFIGLAGLVVAMLAALGAGVSPVALALGFAMTALGMIGAVVGAAGYAWQSVR